MANLFPRQTVAIHLEEPKAFRRFSYSLPEMAITAGVVCRVYRSLTMGHGSNSFVYVLGTIVVFALILFGMITAHIANHPLHQWVWRVPLFVLIEVAAEMATSILLIAVHHEPNGAVNAHWDDWVGLATSTFMYRGIAILIWTLILAGSVQLVRGRFVADEPDDVPEPR